MSQVVNKKSRITVTLEQNFLEYSSSENDHQTKSNVYTFRSNGTAQPLSKTQLPSIKVTSGKYVQEVYQSFPSDSSSSSYAQQTIRLFTTPDGNPFLENYIDVQHIVGVLPYNKYKIFLKCFLNFFF